MKKTIRLSIVNWRNPLKPQKELLKTLCENNWLDIEYDIEKSQSNYFIKMSIDDFGMLIYILKDMYDLMIREDYIAVDKKGWKFGQR